MTTYVKHLLKNLVMRRLKNSVPRMMTANTTIHSMAYRSLAFTSAICHIIMKNAVRNTVFATMSRLCANAGRLFIETSFFMK